MEIFPPEIWLKIIKRLSHKSFPFLVLTCKYFSEIILHDEKFWKEYFLQNMKIFHGNPVIDWKDHYKRHVRATRKVKKFNRADKKLATSFTSLPSKNKIAFVLEKLQRLTLIETEEIPEYEMILQMVGTEKYSDLNFKITDGMLRVYLSESIFAKTVCILERSLGRTYILKTLFRIYYEE